VAALSEVLVSEMLQQCWYLCPHTNGCPKPCTKGGRNTARVPVLAGYVFPLLALMLS